MRSNGIRYIFKKSHKGIIFVILLAISLILISQPLNRKQGISRVVSYPLMMLSQKTIYNFSEIKTLRQENRALKDIVARMTLENANLMGLTRENQRLSELLECGEHLSYHFYTARVIGYDISRPEKSVLINKGNRDGVQRNWGVMTHRGIVGKTLVVRGSETIVQLLQDRNCRVSVIDTRSREVGILVWKVDKYELIYLPPRANVAKGDSLVTSGYGGVFQRNLPVGIIDTVSFSDERQGMHAQVSLFENLNGIEEVIVVSPDLINPPPTIIVEEEVEPPTSRRGDARIALHQEKVEQDSIVFPELKIRRRWR